MRQELRVLREQGLSLGVLFSSGKVAPDEGTLKTERLWVEGLPQGLGNLDVKIKTLNFENPF
jgi:hypothetical protein